MKNSLMMSEVKKWLVRPFRRQEFLKFIGCILLAVTYGNKVQKLWSEVPNNFGKKPLNKL